MSITIIYYFFKVKVVVEVESIRLAPNLKLIIFLNQSKNEFKYLNLA